MEQNKSTKSIISTGTTSIVLIFVMLSLLTFSVLSLTSAQANLRLSRLSADRTTEYYAAENAANDILIQVASALDEAYLLSSSPNAFYSLAQSTLEDMDLTFVEEDRLAYDVPLGENQILVVELELSYDTLPSGRHYTITSWQAISEYDWNPDGGMQLMSPGMLFLG